MAGYICNAPVPHSTQTRQTFVATSGQTSFATVGYVAGGQFIQVYLNGVLLKLTDDYTAENGSDISLTSGVATGDVLEFISFADFTVNNQNFTGGLTVDNDGSTVLTVDRATSDGTIIDLQKSGSSVGSIASRAGVVSTIVLNPAGTDGAGLTGGTDTVAPTNGLGAVTNGELDLGFDNGKFRDLYLSGGVYLGGTGSANKLEDYETGTWTPAFQGATSVTHDIQVGRYTKVGSLVNLEFTIGTTSLSGSQTILISGLPFTQEIAHNQVAARGEFESIYLNYSNLSTARYGLSISSNMLTIRQDNTGGGNGPLAYSDVSHTGLFEIRGNITYRTGV